jgi:shikimate dehydrogenase
MLQLDQYAVVGNPIEQSKSPQIHQLFARATAQRLEYKAILCPLQGFDACVDTFRQAGGRGLNITTPFKVEAFNVATHHSERAKAAGAANALKFVDESVVAENFDGVGLIRDVQTNLKQAIAGRRVLILGAGGATRGLLMPFLAEQPALLAIANRDVGKALGLVNEVQALATPHACQMQAASYEQLSDLPPFDLVFNATSASLRAEFPPISSAVFSSNSLAYELAYGRGLTPFLQIAKHAKVKHLADGIGMLVEQAAETFLWWRGIRPETKSMIEQFKLALV